MVFVIIECVTIFFAKLYQQQRERMSWISRVFFLLLICLIPCIFASLRTTYNDTRGYIVSFQNMSNNLAKVLGPSFKIGDPLLWKVFVWFIHRFVTTDEHVFLFICSMLTISPMIFLIDKQSSDFTLSVFLIFGTGMFLFSLAALRQCVAIGMLTIGYGQYSKGYKLKFCFWCIVAALFHVYAILPILLVFIKKEKIFDVWMFVVCLLVVIAGFTMQTFSLIIVDATELFGKEITVDTITYGSVNIYRVLVYIAPVILVFFTKNNFNSNADKLQNPYVSLLILSGIFMLLSIFGNPILFGRIPYFFLFGTIIAIPYLIDRVFNESSKRLGMAIIVILYSYYEIHSLRLAGAFSRDIFNMIPLF